MKVLKISPFAFPLMLVSCTGSGESLDKKAKAEFETRNEVVVSDNIKDWKFAWAQVGDSYTEYFKFSCTPEEFTNLAGKLGLTSDPLSSFPSSTLWSADVGESNPNQPSWWKLASAPQPIFHKEDYSTIASRSVMSFWYDKDSGHALMRISFWD